VIGGFHFSPCGKSLSVLTNEEIPSKKLGDGERDKKSDHVPITNQDSN
jgi:hypothetical protein